MPRVAYPSRKLSPRTSDMADGEEQQGECWGGSTGASGFDLGNKSFGIADVRSTSIVIVQVGGWSRMVKCQNGGRLSFPCL